MSIKIIYYTVCIMGYLVLSCKSRKRTTYSYFPVASQAEVEGGAVQHQSRPLPHLVTPHPLSSPTLVPRLGLTPVRATS